jgi:hypothetical protein
VHTDLASVEATVREHLAPLLDQDLAPEDIDPHADLADAYGLTSLNRVLFLTAVCGGTGVDLSHFTEHDVAGMRTVRDVTEALAPYVDRSA